MKISVLPAILAGAFAMHAATPDPITCDPFKNNEKLVETTLAKARKENKMWKVGSDVTIKVRGKTIRGEYKGVFKGDVPHKDFSELKFNNTYVGSVKIGFQTFRLEQMVPYYKYMDKSHRRKAVFDDYVSGIDKEMKKVSDQFQMKMEKGNALFFFNGQCLPDVTIVKYMPEYLIYRFKGRESKAAYTDLAPECLNSLKTGISFTLKGKKYDNIYQTMKSAAYFEFYHPATREYYMVPWDQTDAAQKQLFGFDKNAWSRHFREAVRQQPIAFQEKKVKSGKKWVKRTVVQTVRLPWQDQLRTYSYASGKTASKMKPVVENILAANPLQKYIRKEANSNVTERDLKDYAARYVVRQQLEKQRKRFHEDFPQFRIGSKLFLDKGQVQHVSPVSVAGIDNKTLKVVTIDAKIVNFTPAELPISYQAQLLCMFPDAKRYKEALTPLESRNAEKVDRKTYQQVYRKMLKSVMTEHNKMYWTKEALYRYFDAQRFNQLSAKIEQAIQKAGYVVRNRRVMSQNEFVDWQTATLASAMKNIKNKYVDKTMYEGGELVPKRHYEIQAEVKRFDELVQSCPKAKNLAEAKKISVELHSQNGLGKGDTELISKAFEAMKNDPDSPEKIKKLKYLLQRYPDASENTRKKISVLLPEEPAPAAKSGTPAAQTPAPAAKSGTPPAPQPPAPAKK